MVLQLNDSRGDVDAEPNESPSQAAETPPENIEVVSASNPPLASPNPWAAILDAGAALLQSMAAARGGSAGTGLPPIAIERDPVTGQASIRLPLPEPAVLQRLAKAFEPWLR